MLVIGCILLVIFLFLFLKEKRRISLSYLLTTSIACIAIWIIYFIGSNNSSNIIGITLLLLIFGLIPLGVISFGIYLLFNGKLMLQKEGKRLANLLSAAVGLVVLSIIGMGIYFFVSTYNPRTHMYYIGLLLLTGYFSFIFVSYLFYAIFYHFQKVKYTPDFILILGSGLIGDKVPPLLASRLDKGMNEYIKYDRKPKIIVSGGQGPDELVSEAFAMKQYLLAKGMKDQDILMEDKSTNTFQNMLFSKRIMDNVKQEHKSIFVTNNYHVFRASIYARMAELKCEGVGSQTARYYLPSAFLREYIGILVMYKWWHVLAVCLIIFMLTIV
ncbi:YdcF family protein [Priestia taiwanensis]|uniref:Membrane protein n=1 Tax=Priestia taiwanensis TaxID=1347902 RepID=A0A917ELK5_9BACI|nr:YdcF family protein [Priestia taiwanensis]MBM7362216.1 uncharacterized SAM-binding protein YcdF (DUF218 family) [Priestia taiwanensis]GGE60374.1 membrane protein [Priestia taiwanensis]